MNGAQGGEQRLADGQMSRGSGAAPIKDGRIKTRAAKPTKLNGGKPISPRRDVETVADLLLRTHGPENALKHAASERASARRARNRLRFQFWQNISAAIEARRNEVK